MVLTMLVACVHMRSTCDPRGIHMGSTWDPHGIHVGSTWDPCGMLFCKDRVVPLRLSYTCHSSSVSPSFAHALSLYLRSIYEYARHRTGHHRFLFLLLVRVDHLQRDQSRLSARSKWWGVHERLLVVAAPSSKVHRKSVAIRECLLASRCPCAAIYMSACS